MTAEIKLDFLHTRITALEIAISDLLSQIDHPSHNCDEETCLVIMARRVLGTKNYMPQGRCEFILRKRLKEEEAYVIEQEMKLQNISAELEAITTINWYDQEEGTSFREGVTLALDKVQANINELRKSMDFPGEEIT
ncbi:hypothetical protein BH10CHL1_BH10CHL1_06530 [soil metagenome]